MIFCYIILIRWHFIWIQRDIKIIQMNEISSEHRKTDQWTVSYTGHWPEIDKKWIRVGPEIRQKEFEGKIKSFFTPKVVSAIFFLTRIEFILLTGQNFINDGDICHHDTTLSPQKHLLSPISSWVRITV